MPVRSWGVIAAATAAGALSGLWNVLWLIPVVYGAIAARMLLDGYPIAYWYLALAVLVTVGLLLGGSSVRLASQQ
jgi:hypothetical protein